MAPSADPVPDAGDVLWIDLGTPIGHEQAGGRPAVVISPYAYNENSSVMVVCPISRRAREWPFNIALPQLEFVSGFVLVDQIKVVDPSVRVFSRAGRIPIDVLAEIRGKLAVLLGIPAFHS